MRSMSYFDFFDIPISFLIDSDELKRKFLVSSRKWHPDFFTLADAGEQAHALEMSSKVNQAYVVLKDENKRLKYILELKGILKDDDTSIAQDFLMEMMDINEKMMELQMDYSKDGMEAINASLVSKEGEIKEELQKKYRVFDLDQSNMDNLTEIKDLYFKSRYLWRLKDNLQKVNGL